MDRTDGGGWLRRAIEPCGQAGDLPGQGWGGVVRGWGLF